ncbi:MAG TPA: hypothetical protein VF867_08240, partial [Arthrobacter sp.]
TTGISNLGQPCPRHHRLKHGSAWTPAGASKDKPPGWTSPTGRHYASEEQDWEPPDWPDGFPDTNTATNADTAADTETNADPGGFTDTFAGMDAGTGFDHGPPEEPGYYPEPPPAGPFGLDPGPDPDQELPADPFPEWYLFTAAHGFTAAEPEDAIYPEDLDWPEPLHGHYPESFLPRSA